MDNKEVGNFMWNELATTDTASGKKFYTELFGWGVEEMDMSLMGQEGTYTMFKNGEKMIGGMYAMEGEQFKDVPPNWLAYVEVADVDVSSKKVEELGGSIKMGPMDIPGQGRFCIIRDPSGAVIAMMTSKKEA